MDTSRQAIDDLLVLAAQSGERAAMDALVKRWHARLWRHARNVTGGEEAAWEVSQEAWVSIVRGLGRLSDPAGFGAWAYRIVTRRGIDWVRGVQRQRGNERAWVEGITMGVQEKASEKKSEGVERLREAVQGLEVEERALVSMFYQESLTTGQIAAVLGVPRGTVKSRLFHVRKQLKKLIERASDE